MDKETLRMNAVWKWAKWTDECDECREPIQVGQKMLWFTGGPHIRLCETCGLAFRQAQRNGLGELAF